MNEKILKKKDKFPILEKTLPKTFSLTKKDIESIQLIKDRYLSQKIPLTDSAVVRVALDVTLKEKDDMLVKHFMASKKIPLGRKKTVDND